MFLFQYTWTPIDKWISSIIIFVERAQVVEHKIYSKICLCGLQIKELW